MTHSKMESKQEEVIYSLTEDLANLTGEVEKLTAEVEKIAGALDRLLADNEKTNCTPASARVENCRQPYLAHQRDEYVHGFINNEGRR